MIPMIRYCGLKTNEIPDKNPVRLIWILKSDEKNSLYRKQKAI
jgi:hypothetical protein